LEKSLKYEIGNWNDSLHWSNQSLIFLKNGTVSYSLRDHVTVEPRDWYISLIFWPVDTEDMVHKFLHFLLYSVTESLDQNSVDYVATGDVCVMFMMPDTAAL